MATFYDKSDLTIKEAMGDDFELPVYTGVQVTEPTTVEFGDTTIVVTPPNYVLTDKNGKSFGVAEEDLSKMYVKVKES
jgi:hypothetical protein